MADTDSFASRVDKVFGSLGSDPDFSQPWRVSSTQHQKSKPLKPLPEEDDDDGLEQIEYEQKSKNQKHDLELICHSSGSSAEYRFNGSSDRMDVEENNSDEEEECREIRGMVGLDPTLDSEDEEDEYDRTAVGSDDVDSARIYMKKINEGNKKAVSDKNALPRSLYDKKKSARDPRANHLAAKARLTEDAQQASAHIEAKGKTAVDMECETIMQEGENGDGDEETLSGSKRSNSSELTSVEKTEDKEFESKQDMVCGNLIKNEQQSDTAQSSSASNLQVPVSDFGAMANCIVKSQSSKRVRFKLEEMPREEAEHSVSQNAGEEVQLDEMPREELGQSTSQNPGEELEPGASQLPDHVRNPSKYTHYALDWSVYDSDYWNLEAFRACREITSLSIMEEPSNEAKKIMFVPRAERTVEEEPNIGSKKIVNSYQQASAGVPDPLSTSRNRMCVDDIDRGYDADVNCDDMHFNPEELGNKTMKGARKYRMKKEDATEMDM